MNGAGDEDRVSELKLGIRELFRIVVPGAYLAGLFQLLAPASDLVTLMNKGTALLVISVFFLGLFAYGLRPHERWWPYFRWFERERDELNRAIIEETNADKDSDHVAVYKYFLETEIPGLRDRIHYFSSFYYMLIALSLFSAGASIAVALSDLTANHLFRFRSLQSAPHGTFTASVVVIAATIIQLYTLRGLSSIRLQDTGSRERTSKDAIERKLSVAPGVLLGVALGWLIAAQLAVREYTLITVTLVDYRIWVLVTLAIVFERLGSKQWTSIVGEQVVIVRNHADAIRRIVRQLGASR